MTEDATPTPRRSRSLAEMFDDLRTPPAGGQDVHEAFARTHRVGSGLTEALNALRPADLSVRVSDIDFSQMPEARTARAAEETVERPREYQAHVAALVEALQAQAEEQRDTDRQIGLRRGN